MFLSVFRSTRNAELELFLLRTASTFHCRPRGEAAVNGPRQTARVHRPKPDPRLDVGRKTQRGLRGLLGRRPSGRLVWPSSGTPEHRKRSRRNKRAITRVLKAPGCAPVRGDVEADKEGGDGGSPCVREGEESWICSHSVENL